MLGRRIIFVTEQNVSAVPATEAANEAAIQDWAVLLVEHTRARGVALTGDGGQMAGLGPPGPSKPPRRQAPRTSNAQTSRSSESTPILPSSWHTLPSTVATCANERCMSIPIHRIRHLFSGSIQEPRGGHHENGFALTEPLARGRRLPRPQCHRRRDPTRSPPSPHSPN